MIQKYRKCAVSAAREAGEFLLKKLGHIKTLEFKGRINLVTDVDKNSEKLITSRINASFPAHNILTEEKLSRDRRSEYTWIIDPLDGTTNYVHGFPFFCVSIALKKQDRVILGVVYDPVRKELFTADSGTPSRLNGARIRVSAEKRLERALLATGFAYDIGHTRSNNIVNFTKFLYSAQAVRRPGSAALDLCYTACGRFDGYWELHLKPWDVAAGYYIVEKAGGKVTLFSGKPFDCFQKEITASNGFIHASMLRVLRAKKIRGR
jgi:myo-inositol-1(or 4)-monophosphatase